jgi:hypothetical protein
MFARRCHRGAPNEFALQIRRAVCLAAVAGLLVLLGPPGSQVFVGQSFRIRCPAGRPVPALAGGVRFAPVALPGRFDKRRVNALAFPGAETLLGQPRREGGEEFAEKFRARELRAERAEGILIRHRVGFGQSGKRVETAAVEDLKSRWFIAQPRERWEHEDFERRPWPTGRATARGPGFGAWNPSQHGVKDRPVQHGVPGGQRAAQALDLFQAAAAVQPATGAGLDISARCFHAGKSYH